MTKLVCPLCHVATTSDVIDSRVSLQKNVIRRRRVCHTCTGRYTTYEVVGDIHQKGELADQVPTLRTLLDVATDLRTRVGWRLEDRS